MESKQRLRPWLEAQINNAEIPGLHWMNSEKTKFRIPWKHGGKQDWNPDSGQIFKEWARHTGRFREGIDDPDYVKWKTRLRCAFNKAPDIEEVKDESQLDGPDPFRVYILKPRKNGKKPSEPETKQSLQSFANRALGNQVSAPLPAVLDNYRMMSTEESCPSDLKDIKTEDIIKFEETQMSNFNISIDSDIVMLSDNFQSLRLQKEEAAASSGGVSMILKIYYCGKEVMDKKVESPHGCRLYYSTFNWIRVFDLPEWIQPLVYQTADVDFVCLPPCRDLMDTPKQQSVWQSLLEKGLSQGICLATHDDDIYALRFCQCQIFYASECGTSGMAVPLHQLKEDMVAGTDALTKIFDYHNDFLPALNCYRAGAGPKPSPTVYLFFACALKIANLRPNQGSIYATITSIKALTDLGELQEEQVISSDEKCASAILDYEAWIKAEQDDDTPEGNLEDYPPGAAGFWQEFQLENLLPDRHLPEQFPASTNNDEFTFDDDTTLDFSALCDLGLDPLSSAIPEFLPL